MLRHWGELSCPRVKLFACFKILGHVLVLFEPCHAWQCASTPTKCPGYPAHSYMNQSNPVSDLGVEFILGSLFLIASVWGVWMPAGSTSTHKTNADTRDRAAETDTARFAFAHRCAIARRLVSLMAGKLSRVLCFVAKVSVKLSESLIGRSFRFRPFCLVICIAVQLALENDLHSIVFETPRLGGDASLVVVLSYLGRL